MKLLDKIIAVLMLLVSISIFGQADKSLNDSIVSEIKEYIQIIDADESLVEGITEETIEYDGKTGGFGTYNLFNRNTKVLYRIRHNEATDTILNLTFYYKDNQLLYAKAERGYWNKNKYNENFEQEVYFYNRQVIHKTGNGMKPSELQSIGLSHLQTHNEYYDKTKKKN